MEPALLRRLDSELGGGPRTWSDVIVVGNVGPLSALSPMAGDNISNRGLNAILCAPGAGATHFLKIRPTSHAGFQHEVEWTLYFADHPETCARVPEASTFVEGPARVLVEGYVDGTALDVLIRSGQRSTWLEAASEALQLLKPISRALADRVTEENGGFTHLVSLKVDLQLLCAVGLDPDAASALEAFTERAPLPLVPQHGDFWPRNVLRTLEGWKLIDFEKCGEIRLPLYDAFHMIRGCREAAGDGGESWLEAWAASGITARPLGGPARELVGDLEPVQVEAALVAYLVDFAARLHRRGISREHTAARMRELCRLPELLKAGLLRQAVG